MPSLRIVALGVAPFAGAECVIALDSSALRIERGALALWGLWLAAASRDTRAVKRAWWTRMPLHRRSFVTTASSRTAQSPRTLNLPSLREISPPGGRLQQRHHPISRLELEHRRLSSNLFSSSSPRRTHSQQFRDAARNEPSACGHVRRFLHTAGRSEFPPFSAIRPLRRRPRQG